MHSHLLKAAIAIVGLAAFPLPIARASLMASLAPEHYQAHKDLAMNPAYRFACYVRVTRQSGSVVTSSGVAIAPNLILTSAHGIPSATSTAVVSSVTMGATVFASDAVSCPVARWERYPGYVPGNTNTLDFGLIYLDEYIQGFTPIAFGSTSPGQILTLVEYGRIAQLGDSASSPSLGDRMAGYTPVSTIAANGYPSALYFSTLLEADTPANSLNVMGLPGSSGGGYWNENGYLVGIHTAQSNGFDFGFGTALRLDNQDILSFVNPRIASSWAEFYAQRQPELRNISIEASAASQPAKFSGTVVSGPPGGTARLQASLDLGTTDPWADVAGVTLDAEGSATFTNIPDSRPHALGTQSDYFRVVTEPPSPP